MDREKQASPIKKESTVVRWYDSTKLVGTKHKVTTHRTTVPTQAVCRLEELDIEWRNKTQHINSKVDVAFRACGGVTGYVSTRESTRLPVPSTHAHRGTPQSKERTQSPRQRNLILYMPPPLWDGAGSSGPGNQRENVVVCVRARPLNSEMDAGIWRVDQTHNSVMPTDQHPSLARRAGSSKSTSSDDVDPCSMSASTSTSGLATYDFRFDNLVLGDEQTKALYEANVYPVVRSAMDGYNGTVFAYGQTGSGKTYTMSGTDREPGVIPRTVNDVFEIIRENPSCEYLLRVSYLEIYNETLRDLLVDPNAKRAVRPPRIFEEKGRVMLSGMEEQIVTTPQEVMVLLQKGQRARHIGATDWNTRSSRSHCVFQITIESREQASKSEVRVSQLNLIDLAGSERAASEAVRRKEGAFINKSLLTLGTVIAKLTETSTSSDVHVPYRDSKLTRLLQTSLSGDARVTVICTITLDKEHAIETLSTLKFGRRCKLVVTKAQRQTVLDDKALIEQYTREIQELRARLESSGVGSLSPTPSSSHGADRGESDPDDHLSAEREAAAQEVAAMEETRQDLRRQIDHLTRLILTSRSVAAQTPARSPLHSVSQEGSYASPARRGPRMSDLPPRNGDLDLHALRREIHELRIQQQAEREVHKRTVRALEEEVREWEEAASFAQKQNQGAKRELVRLREEHATDEAHREFRELVSVHRASELDNGKDAVHLQARVAALERALKEEKAMRDLISLPERPLALPMEARSGMTPPRVPLRSRSQGGSPVLTPVDEVHSLRRELAEQKALVSTLNACVHGWEARVRQQATMIAKLASLVVDDSDENDNDQKQMNESSTAEAERSPALPDTQARKPRLSGLRPSDVAQGKAKVGQAENSLRLERPATTKTLPGRLSTSTLGLHGVPTLDDKAPSKTTGTRQLKNPLQPQEASTPHSHPRPPTPSHTSSSREPEKPKFSTSVATQSAQRDNTPASPPPPTTMTIHSPRTQRSRSTHISRTPPPSQSTTATAPTATFLPKSPSHSFTPERRRVKDFVSMIKRPDATPMQPEVHIANPVRPEPRLATSASSRPTSTATQGRALPSPPKSSQPLPIPPSGAPTRSLPTPPNTSVKALRASWLAPAADTSAPPSSSVKPPPSSTTATSRPKGIASERKRPPPSPAETRSNLPPSMTSATTTISAESRGEPPSKRSSSGAAESQAKLRARLSAYTAVASEQMAPTPQSGVVRGLALKPVQSMMQIPQGRKSHDTAILRELNELKSMPRVESSRVMYMPQTLPSNATMERLPATGYKTDASAYYI